MTAPLLIEKCRTLREKGFTLGEIIKATKLPKTTVFDHIYDVPFSDKMKSIFGKSVRRNLTKREKVNAF